MMYKLSLHMQRNTLHRGFTVVETLVAITVLAISVAGPLSIAFQGLRSAQLAKDQITASYLAQEGIELVRARRDEDYITLPITWAATFSECTGTNGCWIDMSENPPIMDSCSNAACNGAGENPLDFQTASGLYGHSLSSSVPSRFSRIVRMTSQNIEGSANEFLVTSTVTWTTGSIARSVVVTETITNWQSNL